MDSKFLFEKDFVDYANEALVMRERDLMERVFGENYLVSELAVLRMENPIAGLTELVNSGVLDDMVMDDYERLREASERLSRDIWYGEDSITGIEFVRRCMFEFGGIPVLAYVEGLTRGEKLEKLRSKGFLEDAPEGEDAPYWLPDTSPEEETFGEDVMDDVMGKKPEVADDDD